MLISDLGTIVVIGGTGSLGTALIEHLLPLTSNPVYSLSRDELKQFNQLQAHSDYPNFSTILADVRDYTRMEQVLKGVDTVFHCAALKQVPKGDADPMEFVQTNIIGTWNVARAAIKNGVQRVVFTSSDKSVKPSTLYGSTKFIAEHIMTNLSKFSNGTKLICTRYGNVLGSRGSVIPIWLAQKAAGKPLTITDKRMTRFWLTMQQAVDFLLMAVFEGESGDTFIPLLPAMFMRRIAEVISPGEALKTIGLRPGGEKLHEELVCEEEAVAISKVTDDYLVLRIGQPHEKAVPVSAWICPYISSSSIRSVTKEEMKGFIDDFKGGLT